jgi:hypothetical protein
MSEISKTQMLLLYLPFIIIAVSGYLLLHRHQLEKGEPKCWICRWRQLIFAGSVLMAGVFVVILVCSLLKKPKQPPFFGGFESNWGKR